MMGTGGVRQDERTDSELVLAVRGQDPDAFGVLFDRWYDRCWNVARNIMRSDDLAGEVAQDAMLAGWQRLSQLDNPDAFGGWLLRITRNRALTRLEREGRSRATGDDIVSAMRDRNIADSHDEPLGAQAPPTVEAALEIHDRQELVWAASAALGERDASLLDLHLRHGLTPAEIAEELGVEANAAHQQLFRLRNKLGAAIGSYLLWRNGRTLCRGLAAAVSGDVAFDRSVARAVAKHQKVCDECAERRAGLVSPTKLFASVPFLVVPFQFKLDAAAALAEAGVPMDPSALGGSAPPGSSGSPGDSSGSSGSSGGPPGSAGSPGPSGSSVTPSAPAEVTSPILQASPYSEHAILGGDGSPTGPNTTPTSTPPVSNADGLHRSVGWTTARAAWVKSLGGATVVILIGVLLIGLLPNVALSDLWPFGGESPSIGSETLAGPAIEESSTTEAAIADTSGSLSGPTSNPGDSASSSVAGLTDPSPTRSSSSATTATTATTTRPTTGSTSSTTTSSTTSSTLSTTTDTTATTATTPTTADTRRTTSTDRDTISTTTETSEPTTTTEPPPPADILRFTSRAGSPNRLCKARTDRPYEAIWATENSNLVELFLPDGSNLPVKAAGSHAFCGRPGETISLLASGPGGSDQAVAVLG